MSLKRPSTFSTASKSMADPSGRLSNRLGDEDDDDSEFGDSDDEDLELDNGWRCHPKNWIHFVSSHGGLISLLLIYCFIGAYVFMAVESPHELSERAQLEKERKRLLELLWNSSKELTNKDNWTYVAGVELNKWEERLQDAFRIGLGPTTDQVTWDLSGALFFVTTVITTIGYGSIAPITNGGRIFCIFFAMIGIPLNLLVLTDLGTLMARWGKILSVVILHRCGNKRKEPKKKSSDEGVVLDRLPHDINDQDVPITVDFNSFTDSGIGENQVFTNNSHNVQNIAHHARSGGYEGYVNVNVGSDDEGSVTSDQEEKVVARDILPERRRGRRTGTSDTNPQDEMRRLVLSRASRSHIMADGWPDSPKTRIMSNIPFAREVGNVSALGGDDNDDNENNDAESAENSKESEIAKVSFPVWFCLFLLLSYVAVGALLQSAVENWNFFESFYFCFITLSTIGFGDFVPRKNDETMIGTVIYAVVGLAYTSMCISLASAKLMQFLRLIGTKMNYYKTRQWMKVQAKRRKKKRKRKIATHVIPDISQFNPDTFAPVHRHSVSSETNENGGSGSDSDDDGSSHSNDSNKSGSKTSSQHGDDVSRASTISGSSRIRSLHSSPSNASYLEKIFYPMDDYTHDSLAHTPDDKTCDLSNFESLFPSYSNEHVQTFASEGLLHEHTEGNNSGSGSNKSSQTHDLNLLQPTAEIMTLNETEVTSGGSVNSCVVGDGDNEDDPDVLYKETVC